MNQRYERPWTSEKIRSLPDASPTDVQEIAEDFAKLERAVEAAASYLACEGGMPYAAKRARRILENAMKAGE